MPLTDLKTNKTLSHDNENSIQYLIIASSIGIGAAIILLLFLVPNTYSAGSVRYVSPSGINSGDCTNSGNPCATVQYAVDQAGDGEEIRVAGGTYSGVSTRAGVIQSVYISKPITILGGYPADFSSPPNPDANPTILDAQNQGRVFFITENSTATIDGFQITNGNGFGAGGPQNFEDNGGGIYIMTATVTLSNSQLVSNIAKVGGGLFTYGSANSITISNNVITSNHADLWGGGLYLAWSAIVDNNLIISNTVGDRGAGIYYAIGNGMIINNIILSNTADSAAGGIFLGAGPIFMANNTISYNRADCNGSITGGGGLFLRQSFATLVNNLISYNTSLCWAGGLLAQTSGALIQSNQVLSNTAGFNGGGMALSLHNNFGVSASPTVDGNMVMGNSSANQGGGIAIVNSKPILMNNLVAENHANDDGSGINIFLSTPTISHTTIARNTGGNGHGISVSYAIVTFTNNIVVSHSVGISLGTKATVTMEATLWGSAEWANGIDSIGTGLTTILDIYGHPMFVNPDGRDYHIDGTSAARNAGVDAGVYSDIDGNIRPLEGAPDIGADEYTGDFNIYLPAIIHDGLIQQPSAETRARLLVLPPMLILENSKTWYQSTLCKEKFIL